MSLHVYNDMIVSNGITGSSGRDLSLSLRINTGAQSTDQWVMRSEVNKYLHVDEHHKNDDNDDQDS